MIDDSWQILKKKWYGTLQDLEARSMSIGSSPSSVLVRESYVKTFDRFWVRAMSSQRTTGVVISGQSGTGTHLLSHFHDYKC